MREKEGKREAGEAAENGNCNVFVSCSCCWYFPPWSCACLISYVRSMCNLRSLAGSDLAVPGRRCTYEFLFLLGEKVVVFAKRP